MKFGLEIEKFLYDFKDNCPSEGAFRFIDALTDYESVPSALRHVTNEFVMSMIEIVTLPSASPMVVLKDYLLNYLMLNSVAQRESVTTVGLGSLPMQYQPHMSPKWSYFVQNCILNKKMQSSWVLDGSSALTPAGNCAGIHVHTEIETLPEYLFSNRELVDKFNLSLMLTPMIAFSSSPFFFGEHEAASMRGQRYFGGVYKNFPMNGGLPDVMESSEEVLSFFQASANHWLKEGLAVGLAEEDFTNHVKRRGASWNPIRWNRTWNTLEIRCLDSDRIDLDCAKFIWVTAAMKRMDLKGESLICLPLAETRSLDMDMVDACFIVENGVVSILPSHALRDLFYRSVQDGIKDTLVFRYLKRLAKFARVGLSADCESIFNILEEVLDQQRTTSQIIWERSSKNKNIDREEAIRIINFSIQDENRIINKFIKQFPDTFQELGHLLH